MNQQEQLAQPSPPAPPPEQRDVYRMSDAGHDKLVLWYRRVRAVEDLKERLEKATKEAEEAEFQLGCWMCPDDARVGETFQLWIEDGLLSVQRCPNHAETKAPQYVVGWRKPLGAKAASKMY